MTVAYQGVPLYLQDEREHRRQIANVVNSILTGKINATGSVTLTENVASTTVTDARATFQSAVLFLPHTANAAAEIGAGTLYVSDASRLNGSFVIVHANNAQTDRRFTYVLIG
jgi:hypothetical protein